MGVQRWLLVFLLLAAPPAGRAQEVPGAAGRVHVLSFNRWGDLVTPLERDLAARDLGSNPSLERIFVLSYGWNNDRETAYEIYRTFLRGYGAEMGGRGIDWERTAIVAIGWDASFTGFRKLFNDVVPVPLIADGLAFVPDLLLTPISYWSKAAMADRIGYGGLRPALSEIVEAANSATPEPPEIYLVAHSFGARIVSALLKERLGIWGVGREPFSGKDQVRGALLVQPAAVEINLHETAPYPVLVTQSRHDHANGFLFPLANVPWNAFTFTMFEGVVRYLLFPVVARTVTFPGRVIQRQLPRGPRRPDPGPDPAPESPPDEGFGTRLQRSLLVTASVPLSIAWSLGALPVNYAYTQVNLMVRRPVDHVMDSLAQLPVVEVPVWALGRLLRRDPNWGERGKGIFNLGAVNESAARTTTPIFGRPTELPVYDLRRDILERDWPEQACGLPHCTAITLIDASEDIRHGVLWRENLRSPLVDFTLGWLDPVGAHGDYEHGKVYRLIDRLVGRPANAP